MTCFALVAFIVWVWCASAGQASDLNLSVPSANSEIYARATNRFETVELFKPKESDEQSLAFTLAPLLLQEVARGTGRSDGDQFGALEPAGEGVRIESSKPTVYFKPDTAVLNGKTHATMTYVWFYAAGRGHTTPWRASAQGIRITLDSSGRPAVWEILSARSRTDIVFVSQSVEAAALAQYGGALPGRRYAVERSLADSPRVVVARVIDDGPVPMGPIVYLRSPSHMVSTLICRCMPAQASRVAKSAYYELADAGSIEQVIAKVQGFPQHFLSTGAGTLAKRLRFPASF